jgi:heme/copper-type cytochrome/quinol oxidase subunit 4
MSGVLWGFATNVSDNRRPIGLILSVLPALWAFFTFHGILSNPFVGLIIGFFGVFIIDVRFYFWHMTPDWWLSLRSILTLFVIICLSINLGW